METPAAGGQGSFDSISPELLQEKPLLLQTKGEELEEERFRRRRGAHNLSPRLLFPPLQPGGDALHLKRLREAPPPKQMQVGGGGARILLKSLLFSGNKKEEKKKVGRKLPAERVEKERWSQRFTGDGRDDTVSHCELTVMSL